MTTWLIDSVRFMEHPWLVLALDLAIKATLILLLGISVVRWQQRAAAAVRHRIWSLTFCGLLLLPLLAVALPSWRLPLLPLPSVVEETAPTETNVLEVVEPSPSPAPIATAPPAMGAEAVGFPPQDIEVVSTDRSISANEEEFHSSIPPSISEPAAKAEPVVPTESPASSAETATDPPAWPSWLLWGWAVGFVIVCLPLVVSLFHNWLLGRSSRQVAEGDSLQLLDRLCRCLNLSRRVRLLETTRSFVPMTWGVLWPVVLIPHSARNWTAERKRFVLLHELAHIKRYDVAFQMLARLACALYWFHPLVWHALKRLRQERELACDDCVLLTGERPSDCAEQLVAIARSYRLLAMSSAVAMAETTNLEQRVRALLDQKRRRGPISRRVAGWSLMVAALVITGVAVIRLEAQEPFADSTHATVAENSDKDRPEANERSEDNSESAFHYRGQVVDPNNKPVAGAKLFFVSWVHADLSRMEFKPQAVTDAEGWFDFRPKPSDLPPGVGPSYWRGSIAAMAEGYGFGAEPSFLFETTGEAIKSLNPAYRENMKTQLADKKPIIRLAADDKPITGQILDTEGGPVAGATVQVVDVSYSEDGSLDTWEKAAKEPKADYYSTRRATPIGMNGPQLRAVIPPAKSNAQGKFTLKGIGGERLVELLIRGPGIETQMVKARTRDGELVTLPHQWGFPSLPGDGGPPPERYHPAHFVHVAAPSKPIVGQIIDGDTQKPIAGVRIAAGHVGTFTRGDKPWIFTHTDEEGKYRLEGLPIGKDERDQRLYVYPPDDSGYLPAGSSINTKTDEPSVTKDFVLRKGILVRGKAVDDRTGKPLPGQVSYYGEAANEHLKNYPGFSRLSAEYERRADEQGRFEIPVPPGRGIITFTPDDHGSYQRGVGTSTITIPSESQAGGKYFRTVPSYLFSNNERILKQVEVAPDSAPLDITLELTSGIKVTGRVVDENGKKLSDCLINGGINPGAWYPVQGTEFQVEGYYPDRPRELYFYHPERNLAAHDLLQGDPPKDFAVTLTKAGGVRGRLIDDDGAPIANVRFVGEGVPSGIFGNAKLRKATDENGRFEIRGLIPGRQYDVNALGDMVYGRVLTDITVNAGETKEVGDVKVQPIPEDDPAAAKPQPAPIPVPAKPNAADEGTVTVKGRVLLPDGKPARNATVRAAAPVYAGLKGLLGEDFKTPVSTVRTDAEGRFTISFSKRPYGDLVAREPKWKDYWKQTTIAASMPGFGPDWVSFSDITPEEAITLKLVEDLPIRGRVVDLEGKPIAGFEIKISGPSASKDEDLTEWIKAAKAGELPWTLYRYLNKAGSSLRTLDTPTSATTDAEGRFEVRGIGRERMMTMTFESETVARQSVDVLTRDIPAFDRIIIPGSQHGNPKEPVFGAEFTFTAAPSRPIEGTVIDAKTKQPLAGVAVESYKLATYPYSNHRVIKTVSDEKGRFRIIGMPKGDGNQLILLPNDNQPYLMREVEVPNPDGLAPVEMTVELHQGIWIEGRVTDKTTGEPVHARLYFLPYRTNTFAQAVPEFGSQGAADGDQMRYETKPDGSYRMVGLPGRAVIGALSLGGHYRRGVGYDKLTGPKYQKSDWIDTYSNPVHPSPKWPSIMTEIETPADADSVTVNFQMDPGLKVPFVLVGPDGKPLTKVTVTGKFSDSNQTQIEGHTFEAVNFGSDETRTMLFYHEERKLACVKRITPPDDGKPITVKLEPVSKLTGRLLYEDGSPITGGSLEAYPQPSGDFAKQIPERFITDAEGRFEIPLYPGAPYAVSLQATGLGDIGFATVIRNVEVEPGATKDLGDLYHVPGEQEFEARKEAK